MLHQRISRRPKPINAGSMADIAFLLLTFFLVATTVVEEKGIYVKLPPWETDPIPITINSRNVLYVYINADDQLLVDDARITIDQLRETTRNFIANPDQNPNLAADPRKAIVSIINDRGTNYGLYLSVYNEIKAAYRELWEAAAKKAYRRPYAQLSKAEQKAVRSDIPLVISEAEPKSYEE